MSTTPNYDRMCELIAKVEAFDELEALSKSDPMLAARAYLTIANDVYPELTASAIRRRAARKLRNLARRKAGGAPSRARPS